MINMLILLFLFGAIIAMQSFLCSKKSRWLGLILPLLTFCISLMALLGVVTSYHLGSVQIESQTITEDGVVTKQISEQPIESNAFDIIQSTFVVVYIFVIYNIPTVILLLVYRGSRKSLKKS